MGNIWKILSNLRQRSNRSYSNISHEVQLSSLAQNELKLSKSRGKKKSRVVKEEEHNINYSGQIRSRIVLKIEHGAYHLCKRCTNEMILLILKYQLNYNNYRNDKS